MARETLRFSSEREFVSFALKNSRRWGNPAVEEVKEIIEHEKAHYKMADSLGYDPVYQVYALFTGDKKIPEKAIVLSYQVDYKGERPNPSDLIKILLAPEKPSLEDLDNVKIASRSIRGVRQ
jgi:hypothetical protein